jgi:hypothetical protein
MEHPFWQEERKLQMCVLILLLQVWKKI